MMARSATSFIVRQRHTQLELENAERCTLMKMEVKPDGTKQARLGKFLLVGQSRDSKKFWCSTLIMVGKGNLKRQTG